MQVVVMSCEVMGLHVRLCVCVCERERQREKVCVLAFFFFINGFELAEL